METTTIQAIHADFAGVIRSITPNYPTHQDPWTGPVHNLAAVPTPKRRTFHMQWELDGSGFDGEGIYGGGAEYGSILRIYTSYLALPEDGVESTAMILADSIQLYLALSNRVDPEVAGLIEVSVPVWEYEGDEPGHIWGAHVFRVKHLAPFA